LVAFEALAVSTVMPDVAAEFGRDGENLYGWAFTGFFLGTLIGIVAIGGMIDRGLVAPFLGGLGLFALGLLIGGLAPSMQILIVGRFIQGLGAGAIPPISYVAIGRSMPEELRPRMFALISTAWALPGVLGPAISGIVGDTIGWRAVFLGLLPLVAIAAVATTPALRTIAPPAEAADAEAAAAASLRRRLPLAVIVTVGTGLFTAAITIGDPLLLVVLALPGLALGLFALQRLTPPGTLRAARGLPSAVLIRGLVTFGFFAVDAYVSRVLVDVRGMTLSQAGIVLTATTITWTTGSWVQAHWNNRWPLHSFVRGGMLIVAAGIASFMLVLIPAIPVWFAIPTFALAGFGMGLNYSPLGLIMLREAAPEEQGSASSALSLTDSLGTALGTGISGALVAAVLRSDGGLSQGLAIAFAVGLGVMLFGAAIAGRLEPATQRGRGPALR
jgi:MFS family permease